MIIVLIVLAAMVAGVMCGSNVGGGGSELSYC